MLTSYVKIAWRNLWKHRLFTAINVFGLACGLMVCLIVLIHIKGAFEYDTFHPNRARTYRILTDVTDTRGERQAFATSPLPLTDALRRDLPFVQTATRVVRLHGEVTARQIKHTDVVVRAVDPAFFAIFDYPLAMGQPARQPNTAVISEQTALKFFGQTNPIGQVLTYADGTSFTITGVLATPPAKSHLRFDVLVALSFADNSLFQSGLTDWRQYSSGYTYVLVKPNTNLQTIQTAVSTLATRVTNGLRFEPARGADAGEQDYTFRAQPLEGLSPSVETLAFRTQEPEWTGLLVVMSIGLLTLLLAGFNYVNLTLARSLGRSREVGVRKVLGAVRRQVVAQFLVESVMVALLALGVAYSMLQPLKTLPVVQQWFIGGVREDGWLWCIFVGFTVLTGLLAGLLPARLLSAPTPATALRSTVGPNLLPGVSLRQTLLVAQFSVTLVALIFLTTMWRQQRYLVEADYGFRRERVLNIPLAGVPHRRYANELGQLTDVEGVAPVSVMLGDYGGTMTKVRRQRTAPDSVAAEVLSVDAQFVPTMGLTLAAGRNLPASATDSSGYQVLLNETAVRTFGLGDARQAIGQTVWLDTAEVQVAGVVNDFHTTLKRQMLPLVLRYEPTQFRYVNVAVAPGAEARVWQAARQVARRSRPGESFAGRWYADYLEERHAHHKEMQLLGLLVGLTMSIAGLGLLGIVTYQTETRRKEVSIRKVLGATIAQVVLLLSWRFIKLLALAAAIGIPLGYLAGGAFLADFAYHVGLGVETVGVCLTTLAALGGATVGWRTYRAALADPVDSLRSE